MSKQKAHMLGIAFDLYHTGYSQQSTALKHLSTKIQTNMYYDMKTFNHSSLLDEEHKPVLAEQ